MIFKPSLQAQESVALITEHVFCLATCELDDAVAL